MLDMYLGGCISTLFCLIILNIAILIKTDNKWELTDYIVFSLLILGCFVWPIFIPYTIYKLTHKL